MSISLEYNADNNILYGSYKGAFTFEQFETQLKELVSGADYPADVPTIWDLSETDISQFDWQFIEELLAIRRRFPERGNAYIAIVAPSDLTFGLSRMYASRGDSLPQSMQVFRDIADAEAWLQQSLDNMP
ncbi:MAG: hypothetical protein AAF387_19190 [Pseudomonadota bacterium]